MEAAELAFLLVLLGALLFAIQHPFITASLAVLLALHTRLRHLLPPAYLEALQALRPPEEDTKGSSAPVDNHREVGSSTEGRPRPPLKRGKSQKEILDEVNATSPPPDGKFSRLLLTYQVPAMTTYYETLVELLDGTSRPRLLARAINFGRSRSANADAMSTKQPTPSAIPAQMSSSVILDGEDRSRMCDAFASSTRPPPLFGADPPPSRASLSSRIRGALSRASAGVLRQSQSFHAGDGPPPGLNGFDPLPKQLRRQMGTGREGEVTLRYLREVIRNGKAELVPACSCAVFDSLVGAIEAIDNGELQEALIALLQWADKFNIYEVAVEEVKKKDEALAILDALEKALSSAPRRASDANGSSGAAAVVPAAAASAADTAGMNRIVALERSSSFAHPDGQKTMALPTADKTLEDLMKRLNLRQVAKFEPVFADMEGGESDDEPGAVTVSERKEQREEKHGEKTCEEEVEKLPDGTEIRRTKTRTVNLQQSSKHITISSRGGGLPSVTRHFTDGTHAYDDDEDFEKSASGDIFGPLRRLRGGKDPFAGMSEETSTTQEPGLSTKTKTVQKSSEVLQSVEEKKKKNGKLVADNAAQQQDITELNAKQIESFLGEKLLDRKGDGTYEEATIFRMGRPGEAPLDDAPRPRQITEHAQTFGAKKNTSEDFFRGATLASYIVLNDNLRFHEEQFRKKLTFEFSSTGAAEPSAEFSKLHELLAATDFNNVRMPIKMAILADLDEYKAAAMHPRNVAYPEKPALTGDISILHSVDVTDYLVLHPPGSARPDEVRGGPKDALLVFSTQAGSSVIYQESFIAAYRTVMDAYECLQKLITRYLYMEMDSRPESQKMSNQTFSVIVRIVDELCASELNDTLLASITAFVYHLIRQGNCQLARLLRRRLIERLEFLVVCKPKEEEKERDRESSSGSSLSAGGAIIHPESFTPRKKYSLFRCRADTIFDFKSLSLAQQMTVMDAALFEKIETAEMLWWAEEQNERRCKNLCRFTDHFNAVSYWVRTMVITLAEQRERERVAHKFIKIMKHLRTLGNLNSYLAVLSALDSGPVRRLDWPRSISAQLEEHSQIIDSSYSFRNYRALLTNTSPPCIPYVGLMLQDLTFVHVGNTHYLTKEQVGDRPNLINYNKCWQQFAVLDSVRKFKRWNYTFPRDERILRFINNYERHLNEEQTWELSEKIKPRKWGRSSVPTTAP